jgi:NAD(P)-dependent dehydrogenase (short-subunit alcohol dehydrogenase family)
MHAEAAERVMVIGGTSGIGLACVELFAACAGEVWAVSRNPQRALSALSRFGNVRTAAADATDSEALGRLVATIGPCDHAVVSIAGGAHIGPFPEFGDAEIDRTIDGKLRPYVHAARAALSVLKPAGSLTLVTGMSARRATPGAASLALVNGALESLVPTLAVECAPRRVNAVSPGTTATSAWDRLPEPARRALFDGAAARTPLGRIAAPIDVARAIFALTRTTFVTGVVVPCDGGTHLP